MSPYRFVPVCLIVLTAAAAGCSATLQEQTETARQSLLRQYYTRVDKSDGLSRGEARILAQAQLIFTGQDQSYDLLHPELMREDASGWNFRFRPLIKTLQDLRHKPLLEMAVDRSSGRVRHQRVDHEERTP